MILATCSNCGKQAPILFKGDSELRIPYDWSVIENYGFNTPDFKLLCDENGCWNKEDEYDN